MNTKSILLLLLLLFAPGCAHWVEIHQSPPGAGDFLPSEVGLLIPAILKSTDIVVNGQEIKPGEEFIRFVLQKIQRTHVFSEISSAAESGTMKGRERAVNLELSVGGTIDTNETTNLIKFAANCATLFLFSSELPYKDEFDVTVTLKAIRYDGESWYYSSRIKGASHYRIFGSGYAREEAQDQVFTQTLNSLMRQVMRDVNFFAMEES
jgi:hypothetical protein